MSRHVAMNRSSFLYSIAGLSAPLWSLRARAAAAQYLCPPCGCASDGKLFDQAGPCPSCGMTLVARDDRATGRAAGLPNGVASVQFSFELLANAIFIPVLVNGKGPYLFALDTGSYNSVIASEAADELGVKGGTHFHAVGAGSDSSDASTVASLAFTLPNKVAVSTKVGAMVSMAGLWPLIGKRFYGDIGHDILQQFVVAIDYAKQIVTLYDPDTYRYAGSGTALAAHLYGAYDPQIDGRLFVPGLQPIPVRFTIDTGAGGTIVSAPLVRRYNLVATVGKTFATEDAGIGGARPSEVVGRLSAIQIGPYTIRRPVVALSADTAGSLAGEAISVNLGGNILRRFTITLDYPRNRVILEPNAHLKDPLPYDASGMLLTANGPDFRTFIVDSVLAGTPAATAGLEKGDQIVALDGTSVARYALWQFEDELKKSGSTILLTVQRGHQTIVKTLRLETLI